MPEPWSAPWAEPGSRLSRVGAVLVKRRPRLSPTGKSPQPPLLALGCLLVGLVLTYLRPLATGLPDALRLSASALLVLLAAGLGGWGVLTFKRQATTPAPNGVASALLLSGPFLFSRNPLYLALSTLHLAFGLLLDSSWVLLLTAGLVLLLDRLVIVREERRLQAQFGDEYLAYTRRVRRWL